MFRRVLRRAFSPAARVVRSEVAPLAEVVRSQQAEIGELRDRLDQLTAFTDRTLPMIEATNHKTDCLLDLGHRITTLDSINHRLNLWEESASASAASARADAETVVVLAESIDRLTQRLLDAVAPSPTGHQGPS